MDLVLFVCVKQVSLRDFKLRSITVASVFPYVGTPNCSLMSSYVRRSLSYSSFGGLLKLFRQSTLPKSLASRMLTALCPRISGKKERKKEREREREIERERDIGLV